ncbi:hypothetical protein PLIIFM63780_003806 [Purpureocillium lilacinum]|nr:hypothetical protein PLIIFM63780_003806 [Purpureocillium lilacinum]
MYGLLTLVVAASCAIAHDGRPSQPRYLAGRLASGRVPRSPGKHIFGPAVTKLESRKGTVDGQCGVEFGTTCQSGDCCSIEGWCGKGPDYCSSPDCQLEYSDSCDGNIRPQGRDTEKVARPKVGNVPYGQGIYDCDVDGTIALTFDDGPYTYTEDLLNLLKKYNTKATFFITGRNFGKGAINDPAKPWRALIKRMFDEGHQVASHTWSHQNLATIKQETFRQQMLWNEVAIADILDGRFPTYMRPPYSSSNGQTDAWLGELGYHVVYFDLDTEGYLHQSPTEIQVSKDIWDRTVKGQSPANNTWLAIEHDSIEQTVHNLSEYMLKSMASNGFRGVTVGECLRDPPENWYRRIDAVNNGRVSSAVKSSTTKTTTSTSTKLVSSTKPATTSIMTDASSTVKPTTSTQPATTTPRPPFDPSMKLRFSKRVIYKTVEVVPVPATGPAATGPPSRGGRCGAKFGGMTCIYNPVSKCCSEYGWCGSLDSFCKKGCQPNFGICK